MKKSNYSKLSFKRLWRSVKKSPLQFLSMVLILTLATTLFTGLYASHLEFSQRISDYYETSNMADVWTTTYGKDGPLDPKQREKDYQDVVDASKDYGGVIESRYYDLAKIDGVNSYICLSDNYPTICKPYETNSTDKDNFLIIDRRFCLKEQPKNVEIQVNIGNLKSEVKNVLGKHLKDGKSNIFQGDYIAIDADVSGEMIHPESILFSNNATSPIFLMSRNFLNALLTKLVNDTFRNDWSPTTPDEITAHDIINNPKENISNKYWSNNQYLTRLKNRNDANKVKENISNKFAARISDENDLLLNVDLANLESNKNISMDIIQSRNMAFVFPSVFFLVAILVVSTTISQIILKERNDIGTLRALGASSKKIARHYVIMECLIGLIGVVIGVILGPLILPAAMDLKFKAIYMLPTRFYVFPVAAAITIAMLVIAIIALVSYLTAHKEAKQMPCLSMRPKAIKQSKHLIKSTMVKNKNRTHKLCLKMAVRNMFISSTRSIMVALGVLGCTGLLCCGFGIDDAINYGINHDMNHYFNADAMVYCSASADAQTIVDSFEQLVDDKLVTKYDALSLLPITCYKVGIDDASFTTQAYSLDGRRYKENGFFDTGDFTIHYDSIMVTSKVAKVLNLSIGDHIQYSFLNKQYIGKVGAISDSFYVQGIAVDGSYESNPWYTTSPTIFVRFHKDAKAEIVLEKIKAIEGVSNVMTRDDQISINTRSISSLQTITLIVKLFAILLAAVVLYNLALLNFKENMRNVATMKVLGFTRREIGESLVMEIMILTGVGVILGLAVGFPLEMLILSLNKTPINEFIYYIAPQTFVYSFLITILVSFTINIYLSLKSKKVKMVESLKSIE